MKKTLFTLITIFTLQPLIAMESDKASKPSTTKGVTPLHDAAWNSDLEECKKLIEADANVNACTDEGLSVLHCAFNSTRPKIIQYLAEQGADIRISNSTNSRFSRFPGAPLEICSSRCIGSLHQPLIIYSKFTPYYTRQQLQDAQSRTRVRLWAMKMLCTALPRDMRELILASNSETWQDACCTPLKMHKDKYNLVHKFPLQVIRSLIFHNALKLDKTVEALKAHKFAELKPLMIQAAAVLNEPNPNEAYELDHAQLEQNFGDQIKEVIIKDCTPKKEDK